MLNKEKLIERIRAEDNGNMLAHAKRELASMRNGDEMNERMADNLEELLLVFATQGHSGFSAPYAMRGFLQLASFKPIGPLTGEDDEWNEVGDNLFQNKRCPTVFKENGQAYNIEGKVFVEPSGAAFTSRDSRVDITFPYSVPDKPEYVQVEEQR